MQECGRAWRHRQSGESRIMPQLNASCVCSEDLPYLNKGKWMLIHILNIKWKELRILNLQVLESHETLAVKKALFLCLMPNTDVRKHN
jgi:hypothetical protein